MSSTYSENKIVKPKHEESAFNCPLCGAYAHQKWSETYSTIDLDFGKHNDLYVVPYLTISVCEKCENAYSVWQKGKMCYPLSSSAPVPEETLPRTLKEDFKEASSVYELSPKLACSLLRYITKKLMIEIVRLYKDEFPNIDFADELNRDVHTLTHNLRLPRKAGDALMKAFKNNDNYTREFYIESNDNEEQALKLFNLLNFVAHYMITKKKAANDLFTNF